MVYKRHYKNFKRRNKLGYKTPMNENTLILILQSRALINADKHSVFILLLNAAHGVVNIRRDKSAGHNSPFLTRQ